MTRVCSYCDKPMGWKCDKCSGSFTEIEILEPPLRSSGLCETCNEFRYLDAGGTTHGICDECAEKEKEKIQP